MRAKARLSVGMVIALGCLTGRWNVGPAWPASAEDPVVLWPAGSSQNTEDLERQMARGFEPDEEIEESALSQLALILNQNEFRQLQDNIPVPGRTPDLQGVPLCMNGRCARIWDDINQYIVMVPSATERLRVRLVASPPEAKIDLAVRFNQPVEVVNGQLSGHSSGELKLSESREGVEEVLISRPMPGTYYVAVGTREQASTELTLKASFGKTTTVLQLDDGTFETLIGYPEGRDQVHFVNRITPLSYPATLTGVHIFFGRRAEQLMKDSAITILAGTNPSGTSDISGSLLVRTSAKVLFTSSSNDFNHYEVKPPVTINSGDFVIGFVTKNEPDHFPVAYDQTFARGRSYLSTDGSSFLRVEDFGTVPLGNFGIRAEVEGSRPVIRPEPSMQQVSGGVPLDGTVEYEFDPAIGATYRFSTCEGTASFDTGIEVFQDGVLLSQNNTCNPPNRGSTQEVTVRFPGRVVVRVRGTSASAAGGFRMTYSRTR